MIESKRYSMRPAIWSRRLKAATGVTITVTH
jgi:hypothetical protein